MPRAGWVAAGAIAAALLAAAAPPPGMLVVAGCVALVLVVAGMVRHNVSSAAIGLGAGLIVLRVLAGAAIAPVGDRAAASATEPTASDHEAVVVSLSAPSAGQQRAIVELRPPEPPDRVYANLPRYPPVAPGDVVRFRGELEAAPTEGGFAEYLARSGIAFTARPRGIERLGADGSPMAALESVRRTSAQFIAAALPEPQAGLGAAMMIGLRDLVSRDVAADFRTSGLSHVVAISGWHICLLGAVVSGLLRGLSRRRRSALVLVTIVGYAILAGASPSVLRAAVMASVVLLARESGRRGQASAALAITAAGMLLVDPATISDLGFQLSVAATAGLLAWAGRLHAWLSPRLPHRTPAWLLEALAVSLAAQAATLPLVLFHFGTLPLVSPLANLLVAPLVAPAMLFTTVAFACGALIGLGVPALLLAPLSLVGSLTVGAMVAVAHVTAGLPFANVTLPEPVNIIAAATCAAVVFWLSRARPRQPARAAVGALAVERPTGRERPRSPHSRRLAVAGAAAALSILLVVVYAARPDGRLHMTVLDVGQGDAILLEGPRGGRILVDTGPDPDRLLALLDERVPVWDRRLDLVVITHPHEDHISGVALLLDRYRIGAIAEPGMVGPGPGDAAYRRRIADLGRQSSILAAGDSLWLDGIRLDVLWPLPGQVALRPPDTGTGINNVSIVLDLHFGERRMLLTGDVEEQVDPRLLAADIAVGSQELDVLKVAHHGSGTATTDALVEQMSPEIAIVSAGWGNPYGHPSPATVARLVETGATLYRTDIDGSVEISTDGSDLVAHAVGGRPRTPRPTRPPTPGIGFCPLPADRSGRRAVGGCRLQSAGCRSPRGRRRPRYCCGSIRRIGSSPTRRRSPRSLPSWPGPLRTATPQLTSGW